jgi:hypothetical protein
VLWWWKEINGGDGKRVDRWVEVVSVRRKKIGREI